MPVKTSGIVERNSNIFILMKQKILFSFYALLLVLNAFAQADSSKTESSVDLPELPLFTYGNGLCITSPDSLFELNFRFRMQNRASFGVADGSVTDVEARVRRLRLRFDGYVYSPKIAYAIQLSFATEDMGDFTGKVPNIIRDAVVYYRPNKNFTLFFGQTKLPGNRQRVNSSGDLQLADRSTFNSIFNIDRDFGVQFQYKNKIARNFNYILKGAISTGEGRNWIYSPGAFLSYTGRVEILPLGEFSHRGDYYEGDLAREKTPKLSIGASYNYNDGAMRTAGQRGNLLYEAKNISHQFVDVMFKYRGFAVNSNIGRRYTADALSVNPEDATQVLYVFKGHGGFAQASYLLKSNFEFVGRFENIIADQSISDFAVRQSNFYTVGINKYLRGHRLKLQIDATYAAETPFAAMSGTDFWQFRFQVELGI